MYKLFTHSDLDGVGCAVLAKLAWADTVDITYCHGKEDLNHKITEMYKKNEWKNYNVIFVTDLSFDISVLEECPKLQYVLRLFDHHASAVEPFKPFSWAQVQPELNGRLTCGTELFYRYLLAKGKVRRRDFFVEQIRLYDTWDWYYTTSKLPKYLSDVVMRIGLQYFVETYVERLRKSDVNELSIFNEYERQLLLYLSNREDKDVKSFLDQTFVCEVESNEITPNQTKFKVGVVFNNSFYSSLLGNEMCRVMGVDIAFMVNMSRSRVEVRTARDDIDLSVLMNKFYGGGGHKKAAGGFINYSEDLIREKLLRFGKVVSLKQGNV